MNNDNDFMPPELSRRLGRIWRFLPSEVKDKYQSEVGSYRSWKDVPKELQTEVEKLEKSNG